MKKFIIIAVVIINCFIGLSYSFPTRGRLVEGDIRLPFGLSKSLASSNELNIWPGGVIPYTIDAASNFTETQKATIKNAMAIITANTGCITFVEKTAAHPNWIVIKSLDGCWSYIGNIKRGAQEMSLSKSGCIYKGTVIHEILHAMGFWHEQNRPDRDNYVKISYENIRDGMADQFEKYTSGKYFSTPYDFKSIMHYDEYSFSKNGLKTITPLQAGIDIIPSYNRQDSELLSSLDIQAIRSRYSCAGTAPITTTTTTTTTTTIVSACVDADPTCIYFYNNVNKNTYCTLNYSLNGVRFSTACRKLCGVCV